MMKKVILLVLFVIPSVFAQLDWTITDVRCGNEVLDDFELCEKGVEASRCDALGEKLGIDMGCFYQHCTCAPRVNMVYCGNNRRDFNEMCDGTSSEDMCPVLGEIMGNVSLKCNPKTCGCDIVDAVPADYNPETVKKLEEKAGTASVCGDKKIERDEDCDPPNTLCTTGTKDAGICTEKCKCVAPQELDTEPELENITVQNATVPLKVNETNDTAEIAENITETKETTEPKPGFIARIWTWFIGLFS